MRDESCVVSNLSSFISHPSSFWWDSLRSAHQTLNAAFRAEYDDELALHAQHPVERVGGLIDERLRIVIEGMEILEGQVTVVTDFVERLDDGRPVGGAVEQRA